VSKRTKKDPCVTQSISIHPDVREVLMKMSDKTGLNMSAIVQIGITTLALMKHPDIIAGLDEKKTQHVLAIVDSMR
jgi:phosphomevalonate kinase